MNRQRILVILFLLGQLHLAAAASRVRSLLDKPSDWYSSDAAQAITANVLAWQTKHGDWPKNTDTTAPPKDASKTSKGTFDNQATTNELRFLARVYQATQEEHVKQAFLTGLDHILNAQYEHGGWPQRYPAGKGYARHITFNDHAMVHLMEFVNEVATESRYEFLAAKHRTLARAAFDRGVACIIKCQIMFNGKPLGLVRAA